MGAGAGSLSSIAGLGKRRNLDEDDSDDDDEPVAMTKKDKNLGINKIPLTSVIPSASIDDNGTREVRSASFAHRMMQPAAPQVQIEGDDRKSIPVMENPKAVGDDIPPPVMLGDSKKARFQGRGGSITSLLPGMSFRRLDPDVSDDNLDLSPDGTALSGNPTGVQKEMPSKMPTGINPLLPDFNEMYMVDCKFLEFQKLKSKEEFPRNPDDRDLLTPYRSINRQESLIVYVSHAWLKDAEGQSHPDNNDGDKYRLLVTGIEALMAAFVGKLSTCYLWIDYCCLNQENWPLYELMYLDKLMIFCDCIFSPMFDEDAEVVNGGELKEAGKRDAQQYMDILDQVGNRGVTWSSGQALFMSRAWCRLEMYYAFHLPLFQDKHTDERKEILSASQLFTSFTNTRPFICFGTIDEKNRLPPRIVPMILETFENAPILAGSCSNPEINMPIIKMWYNSLSPFLRKLKVGFEGELGGIGDSHGFGRFVYENGDRYDGDFRDGIRHGSGMYVHTDGACYAGDWKNNLKCGEGSFRYSNGDCYRGTWVADKRHGYGLLIYYNCDEYEGQWVRGRRHGPAVYRFHNGNTYEGEYRLDKPHGFGCLKFLESQEFYLGEWVEGLYHGKGEFTYSTGDHYDGDWIKNEKSGHGVMKYSDGGTYTGIWLHDVYSDQFAERRYSNGDKYEGAFVNGLKNGNGVLNVSTAIYEGNFVDDMKCGHGRIEFSTGELYEGNWKNDKYNGIGTAWYPDGNTLTGNFVDGIPNGHGLCRYANGNVYEGDFVNHKRHGYGTMNYKNGDVYAGHWKDDVWHGQCKHSFLNGDVVEGSYFEGILHGTGKIMYGHKSTFIGEFIYGSKNGSGVYLFANGAVYEGSFKDDKFHGYGVFKYSNGNSESGFWIDGLLSEIAETKESLE